MEIEFEDHFPNKKILYSALTSIAIWQKPESYLEIGVNEGESLSYVLKNSRPKRLTLCDNWGPSFGGTGRGGHAHIDHLLKNLNYKNDLQFLSGDSRILLPDHKGKYDLILVDGDHTYNGAWLDLWNTWRLLNPGGIIVMDDLIHPSHKYLHQCIANFRDIVGAKELYLNIERPQGVMVIQKDED